MKKRLPLLLVLISIPIVAFIFAGKANYGLFSSIKNEEILIKGGKFVQLSPETGQNKEITIESFYLDKNLTTVAEFDEFVKTTGYVTEADKFGNSAVLESGIWLLKDGANYWYPFGKDKDKAEPNHPVTQVSWNDAVAYAKWKGKRLPTEAEWEYAASNKGKNNFKFPWGNDLVVNEKYQANTFQGSFPSKNTKLDGYEFTSPVGTFPSNALGLNDIGGNVWEWCSDIIAPTPQEAEQDSALRRPTKGASYLTDVKNDPGAAIFGRSSTTPETGVCHTGFRLAKNSK